MWKAVNVWDEASGLGALTIEARVAHDTLAIALRVCREMTLRRARRLEDRLIEVGTAVLRETSPQSADYALLMNISAPE